MIGKRLVTKQSGPEGKPCNSVMVTTRMFTRKELYLSVMMERSFDVSRAIRFKVQCCICIIYEEIEWTLIVSYLADNVKKNFLIRQGPVVIASSQGGVNIEEVAETNPEAITYLPIDVRNGLSCEDATKIACSLKVPDVEQVRDIVMNLYDLFVQKEALLLEINPLVIDICENCMKVL